MNVTIKFGTGNIDWVALCEIFRLAPFGTQDPEKMEIAAKNSFAVYSALVDGKMIFIELY